MRYLYLHVLFFLLISSAYSNETVTQINEAINKINNGSLVEGKAIMDKLANKKDLSIKEKTIVNNKLAWFYDEIVGNPQYALRYSGIVIESSLPEADEIMVESKNRIIKIQLNRTKYFKQDRIIRRMRINAKSKADAWNKIKEIEQLLETSPDYPGRPVAYHYLGKHYLYLQKYHRSYKIFSKLLKSRPGIVFLLPTKALIKEAREKWHYFIFDSISKFIIIISLIILSALLYLSEFWEWFNLKYLIIIPITVVVWGIFLMIVSWGLEFFIPAQEHKYLPAPYFIHSKPFSPSSGILITIFLYGIIGIVCSFLLVVALQYFNKFKIKILISSTVMILFMTSIFTIFFLKYCYHGSLFEKRIDSNFPVITGHFYFREADLEPHILIEPRKYPDLTLENSNDKFFIQWIIEQYSAITGKPVEHFESRH